MRREFILVLLGIICTSTLSSFFANFVQQETDKVLLAKVAGSVVAGNFSYWQIGYNGPLQLELISLTGDADIYVADHMRPSYEVGMYDFSSTTCGDDIINIPATYYRPLGIAVFGHWSHNISEYSIQVYLDTSKVDNEKQVLDIEQKTDIDRRKKEHRKTEEEQKSRFLKLLSVLDIVFEVFVL